MKSRALNSSKHAFVSLKPDLSSLEHTSLLYLRMKYVHFTIVLRIAACSTRAFYVNRVRPRCVQGHCKAECNMANTLRCCDNHTYTWSAEGFHPSDAGDEYEKSRNWHHFEYLSIAKHHMKTFYLPPGGLSLKLTVKFTSARSNLKKRAVLHLNGEWATFLIDKPPIQDVLGRKQLSFFNFSTRYSWIICCLYSKWLYMDCICIFTLPFFCITCHFDFLITVKYCSARTLNFMFLLYNIL